MTIRTRKTIFYILIVFFFVIGSILLLYSNGWQFDFKNFKFYQSGAIEIGGQPENSLIKIKENNYKINSQSRKNGILIPGLFPQTYTVTIEKDGYNSWIKNLVVKPSLITKTYPLILIPKNLNNIKPFMQDIKSFWAGPKYNVWQNQDEKLIINGQNSSGSVFIDWFYDDATALTSDKAGKNYFAIQATQNNLATNLSLLFNNLKDKKSIIDTDSYPKIQPYPFDDNKAIIISKNKLYILDFLRFDLEIIPQNPAWFAAVKNNNLFLIRKSGFFSYNLTLKNEKLITDAITSMPSAIKVSTDGGNAALVTNGKLIIINISTGLTKEISASVKQFSFSPDSEKLAYVENNGRIKVLFLKDQLDYSNKKAGDTADLSAEVLAQAGLSTAIPVETDLISWHKNSAYLFIKYPDKLSLLEIDDRTPVNEQFINDKIDNYSYDLTTNLFYYLESNNLYKLPLE
ncbi:MAG: Uncharacterized protein Athens071426_206 [Parcubacteria group bacterium Athens0714_26]|nr:MAG: Uncharacterized protein Athens071426_206 [Parcubacteria group bacterium Athens0714_26]